MPKRSRTAISTTVTPGLGAKLSLTDKTGCTFELRAFANGGETLLTCRRPLPDGEHVEAIVEMTPHQQRLFAAFVTEHLSNG